MTLEDHRERGDLIEIYKIPNRMTRVDPKDLWEVREAGNGARLVKELAKNGKGQRQVQKWNLLITCCPPSYD